MNAFLRLHRLMCGRSLTSLTLPHIGRQSRKNCPDANQRIQRRIKSIGCRAGERDRATQAPHGRRLSSGGDCDMRRWVLPACARYIRLNCWSLYLRSFAVHYLQSYPNTCPDQQFSSIRPSADLYRYRGRSYFAHNVDRHLGGVQS